MDELDFFGFNASQKPKEKGHERCNTSVETIVSEPVDNASAKEVRKVKGSKPRRKRKLSEGALEEQLLENEARRQASLLLAPSGSKDEKSDARLCQSRKKLVETEAVNDELGEETATSDDEGEEDDDDGEENVRLFKSHGNNADAKGTRGKAAKQTEKEAAQKLTGASADQYVRSYMLWLIGLDKKVLTFCAYAIGRACRCSDASLAFA